MSNRKKFLSTIKNRLRDSLLPEAEPEHPGPFQGYSCKAGASLEELTADFTRELEALSGHVYRVDDIEDVPAKILEILRRNDASRIIAWDDEAAGIAGLKKALHDAGIEVAGSALPAGETGRKARLTELDDVRVGITGADGGLADTGSIALISGSGRGRLASLLPPVHVALLSKRKLYPSLPAFLSDHPTATADGSNLVLICGPSRTGDIEMTLSMGVHGPGEVHVIITP
jgi:L-lactate dehydrogenase complex protein LldG